MPGRAAGATGRGEPKNKRAPTDGVLGAPQVGGGRTQVGSAQVWGQELVSSCSRALVSELVAFCGAQSHGEALRGQSRGPRVQQLQVHFLSHPRRRARGVFVAGFWVGKQGDMRGVRLLNSATVFATSFPNITDQDKARKGWPEQWVWWPNSQRTRLGLAGLQKSATGLTKKTSNNRNDTIKEKQMFGTYPLASLKLDK